MELTHPMMKVVVAARNLLAAVMKVTAAATIQVTVSPMKATMTLQMIALI
jgi:hypothetical protein